MANTYPLQRSGASQYTGKSPSAVTNQAEQYKNMLGSQVASEDVGLFYQLNNAAGANQETAQSLDRKIYGGPVEAGGQYA